MNLVKIAGQEREAGLRLVVEIGVRGDEDLVVAGAERDIGDRRHDRHAGNGGDAGDDRARVGGAGAGALDVEHVARCVGPEVQVEDLDAVIVEPVHPRRDRQRTAGQIRGAGNQQRDRRAAADIAQLPLEADQIDVAVFLHLDVGLVDVAGQRELQGRAHFLGAHVIAQRRRRNAVAGQCQGEAAARRIDRQHLHLVDRRRVGAGIPGGNLDRASLGGQRAVGVFAEVEEAVVGDRDRRHGPVAQRALEAQHVDFVVLGDRDVARADRGQRLQRRLQICGADVPLLGRGGEAVEPELEGAAGRVECDLLHGVRLGRAEPAQARRRQDAGLGRGQARCR